MADVRLINANALLEKECCGRISGEDVRKAPTINPDDCRPQGRWMTERCNHVPHRLKNPEKWVICKCSLCGYSNGRKQSNYCPNCGAKMIAEDTNVLTKQIWTERSNTMNKFELVKCKDCTLLDKCPSGKICIECNEDFARFCQFWQPRKEQDNA